MADSPHVLRLRVGSAHQDPRCAHTARVEEYVMSMDQGPNIIGGPFQRRTKCQDLMVS